MQWKPEHEFKPIPAADVAAYQKFVHREFLGLLRYSGTDDEHRARLRSHKGIDDFAKRHPIIFEKITNREIATNQRLMGVLEFNLYIRKLVESGKLTEENGKAIVSQAVMQSLVNENIARGNISKEDLNKKVSVEKPDAK